MHASDDGENGIIFCVCQSKSRVNGQCTFERRCNDANLIYKSTCTIDGQHYIGKTQNNMKSRIFEHITNVGKFWMKRQHLNHLVGLEVEEIIDNARSTISAPATSTLATVLPPTSTPRSARSASRSRRTRVSA